MILDFSGLRFSSHTYLISLSLSLSLSLARSLSRNMGEAVSKLALALSETRESMVASTAGERARGDQPRPPLMTLDALMLNESRRITNINVQGINEDVQMDDIDTVDSQTKQDSHYMYRQPVSIPTNAVEESFAATSGDNDVHIGSSTSGKVVSATIIFNLALAHHLASQEHQPSDPEKAKTQLQKAVKLYELAHKLQDDVAVVSGSISQLFMLTTINNMAIAYHALEELETSQRLIQHLLSTMMYIIDVTSTWSSSSTTMMMNSSIINNDADPSFLFVKSVYEGMFRNITPLLCGDYAAAAA